MTERGQIRIICFLGANHTYPENNVHQWVGSNDQQFISIETACTSQGMYGWLSISMLALAMPGPDGQTSQEENAPKPGTETPSVAKSRPKPMTRHYQRRLRDEI